MSTRKIVVGLGAALALAFASTGWGQVFTKYGPVAGVQKSTGTTYQNTAAVSADIRGLWTGTCDATTFLQGAGACAQVSLTTNVTGVLPVANGGTGVGTLASHGVLLGAGTGNVTNVAPMALDTLLQGKGASVDPAAIAVNNCGDATHALSYNTTTHAFGCQNITAAGTGTVTSVGGGTGITASPNPIVGAGTLAVDQTASLTWTGTELFRGGLSRAGTTAQVTLGLTSTIPVVGLTNSSAPTDQKSVEFVVNNTGDLIIQNINEAANATKDLMRFTRGTGAALANAAFGNVNDNNTYQFLGTGLGTFSGPVKLQISAADVFKSCPTNGNIIVGPVACGSEPSVVNPGAILASGTVAGGNQSFFGRNTSNATNAINFLENANDIVGREILMWNTSSTYIGTFVGVTGPSAGIAVGGATDLYIGSNNRALFKAAATGNVIFPSAVAGLTIGSPTGGDQGPGTLNATGLFVNGASVAAGAQATGSFTMTMTSGCTTTPSGTATYAKTGNIVTLRWNTNYTCTGNSATVTFGGLPALIRPTNTSSVHGFGSDNSGYTFAFYNVANAGTVGVVKATGAWGATGTYLFPANNITYTLD